MRSLAIIIACVFATTVMAEQFPLVSVIFEFTVGRDGTRQNIRIVKIEQPVTHKDLSAVLTQAEKLRGIRNMSRRPSLSTKDAGRKLYNVAIFDLRTRRYATDE